VWLCFALPSNSPIPTLGALSYYHCSGMPSPLVMQNDFHHRRTCCIAYSSWNQIYATIIIQGHFFYKEETILGAIEIHKGCKTVNFTVNVLSMCFYSSKKIETLHPSLWYLLFASHTIRASSRGLGGCSKKLCKHDKVWSGLQTPSAKWSDQLC